MAAAAEAAAGLRRSEQFHVVVECLAWAKQSSQTSQCASATSQREEPVIALQRSQEFLRPVVPVCFVVVRFFSVRQEGLTCL